MMPDAAVNRLSYAEARSSNSEAMMDIVRHQRELEQATVQGKTEAEQQARFEDQARQARAAHHIDKTV